MSRIPLQIRSACTNLDIIVTFERITKPEEPAIAPGQAPEAGATLILVKMVHMQNQMIKIWTHDRPRLCIQSRQT